MTGVVLRDQAQIVRVAPGMVRFLVTAPELYGTGCWPWPGKRDRWGYGRVKWHDGDLIKRETGAHRLAYVLTRGPIPAGLVLDHVACDNGAHGCANPQHCEPATVAENNARMNAKRYAA